MSTDALSASNGFVLAPRAAIAQLELELRASRHEVAAAEAEYAGIDQDAAVVQLRARLAPLMDARRRALDEALAHAEVDAAEAVAAARLELVDDDEISVYDDMLLGESAAVELYDASTPGAPTVNIIIDAEAFARVIATVLGEHLAGHRTGVAETAAAPKPTMKHARHLDVFLVGVATLIVLVILAAWIG